jgi:hypothetical protein
MTTNETLQPLNVGDRVRWRDGKRPRIFAADELGTVESPPRRQSGETVYVRWDNQGLLPVSRRAIEPA